jgi:glycosyltransferase involved in cell wall biosynthesis
MMGSKISIITVCYNEPNLAWTCDSIVNQTFQDFEWIVIDGGSNQETLDIFEKYKYRMNYFVSEKDKGIRYAFNKGIAKAAGAWCNFMNAGDSFYGPDVLEKVSAELEKHQDCDVLYGNACFTRDSRPQGYARYHRNIDRFFFFSGTICHQASFIKRELFELYGCYDDSFKMISDRVHFYKLYSNNCKFYHFDEILVNYDVTGEIARNIKERCDLEKKFHSQYYSPEEIKKFTVQKKELMMEIVRKKRLKNDVKICLKNPVDQIFYDGEMGLTAVFLPVSQIKLKPTISVIVPVYNAAPFLCRCLDSIIGQTLNSLEIICINDASSDKSMEILREFAVKDKRIKLIDFAENKGVSAARNAGIKAASGEYLGFVDSDDYIDKNFYWTLYGKAFITDADMVEAPVALIVKGKKDVVENRVWFYSSIFKTRLIKEKKIFFPEGINFGEDAVFMFRILMLVKNRQSGTGVVYNYVKHEKSASHYMSADVFGSIIRAYDLIFAEIHAWSFKSETNKDQICKIIDLFFRNLFYFFRTCPEIDYLNVVPEKLIKYFSKFSNDTVIVNSIMKEEPEMRNLIMNGDIEMIKESLGGWRKKLAGKLRTKIQNR